MKPDTGSERLLKITQSKAKMYEYGIPEEDHIVIPTDPSNLFNLSIGILGDISSQMSQDNVIEDDEYKDNLVFSARFFDSYLNTRFHTEIHPYLILIGSATYYLSGLPGSSLILAKFLDEVDLDLYGSGLENLLYWLLRSNWSGKPVINDNPYQFNIEEIIDSFSGFITTGENDEEVISSLSTLSTQAYNFGSSRQLFFTDIISAVTKKRMENSTWRCLPAYSDISFEKWIDVIRKNTFMKELWPSQQLMGEAGVFKGKSAIVQMPTSAGKTRATEIIIRSAFMSERTSLAIIVAPYRALCHEIRSSLFNAFRGEQIGVDEFSDVLQIDYELEQMFASKQVLVVTPEKLLYVLRQNPELAEHIGLLIYDEGHQFDSGTRGITYELLLTSLKMMVPEDIQTILISAVISNAEVIGNWLINGEFETVYGNRLTPTYRTVAFSSWVERLGQLRFVDPTNPDEDDFFVPRVIEQQQLEQKPRDKKVRYFPERNDGQSIALYLGLKLVNNGSVAIFCSRKATVSTLCAKIINAYDRGLEQLQPKVNSDQEEINKLVYLYACNLGEAALVTISARIGIFSHHADIPNGIRLAVEHAMKNGLISYIMCTSTLAQGVNLPIRYLIVTSIYQTQEPISTRDFHNLIGRTGRADKHTEGSVIFADPDVYDLRNTDNERRRWDRFKNLLDSDKSEPCASSLLSLLDPLLSDDKRYKATISITELISMYMDDVQELYRNIEEFSTEHSAQNFTKDGLETQIDRKLKIVSSIENFILSQWSEDNPALEDDDIVLLATNTLAFSLADEEQQAELIEIFLMLEKNIENKISDVAKRKVYSRTLYGVLDSINIEEWINENIQDLVGCQNHKEVLGIIWPLISVNMPNRIFNKIDKPEILPEVVVKWIDGNPYFEIYNYLVEMDAKLIAGQRKEHLKIDYIVDLCENAFSFNGTLLINAITELLRQNETEETRRIVLLLLELQKMMKYGLSSLQQIVIFELGFSDRVIAQDLAVLLIDIPLDYISARRFIRQNENSVRGILQKYPSYFEEVLDRQI